MNPPTYEDVTAAAVRINPYVHRTPILSSSHFDATTGCSIFFKAENLQKVGAFKVRGATNAVLSLADDSAAAGIITHSSGNHGQAVAYAGRIRGASVTVVMPHQAPAVKIDAIKGYGATVILCDQAARESTLAELQARTGATTVHPFDDANVIAGQGTASLEFVDQIRDLDVLVAPIGGGGLLSGTSLVAAENGIDVIGAEPEAVDDSFRSLRDGVRYPATGNESVADGLLTGIGVLPFSILTDASRGVLTVSDEEILHTMREMAIRMKVIVEPSGAAALAAIRRYPEHFKGRRVGVIISGGNVELSAFYGASIETL